MSNRRGGDGGFIWVEVAAVLLIAAALAAMAVPVFFHLTSSESAKSTSYELEQRTILIAIEDYLGNSAGKLPVADETITIDGRNCQVIDICELLTFEAINEIPSSACKPDGGKWSCLGYSEKAAGHYIWALDRWGLLHSAMINDDRDNYRDGFRKVFP